MQYRKRASPLLILLVLLAVNCGLSQREATIKATHVMLVTISDGFEEWDEAQQKHIVETATSYEQGVNALVKHYNKRTRILEDLVAAYRALALAVSINDEKSFQQMLSAVRTLKNELAIAIESDSL